MGPIHHCRRTLFIRPANHLKTVFVSDQASRTAMRSWTGYTRSFVELTYPAR